MVLDSLGNFSRYTGLHHRFSESFDWLTTRNLESLEPATYTFGNGLRAIVSDNPGKATDAALEKFECHNQYIDIQLLVRGKERMGWKFRGNCVAPKGEYSQEKDVLFFGDTPDVWFNLAAGDFTIFFPEDVHAPMVGEGLIKKVVVKIPVGQGA